MLPDRLERLDQREEFVEGAVEILCWKKGIWRCQIARLVLFTDGDGRDFLKIFSSDFGAKRVYGEALWELYHWDPRKPIAMLPIEGLIWDDIGFGRIRIWHENDPNKVYTLFPWNDQESYLVGRLINAR